jgi:ubiquinone/menaquinone biosynthesis C-methylase UbiE
VKLAKAFTKSISSTLGTVLDERAYFLKKIYDKTTSGVMTKERYLDVGAGRTTNGRVFGEDFHEVLLLDINPIEQAGQEPKMQCIIGDAQALPLKENTVDLLSLISTIEHVPDPQQALNEATRVIRAGGELVIQVPNVYLPIDLHTGIFNPFWIPKFARKTYLKIMGYHNFLNEVYGLPREKEITGWIRGRMQLVGIHKVIYPPHFVPISVRPIYRLLTKLGFLTLIPLGFLYVYKKGCHSVVG